MTVANKFINNMCYFNFEEYFNNMDRTPYHYILDISRVGPNSDNVYISTVDLHGQDQTIYLSRNLLYKKVKVMAYDKLHYTTLIKNIFNRR